MKFCKTVKLLLLSLLCSTSFVMAQSGVTITGTVRTMQGELLPGVSVLETGTRNGTATDAKGNFSIKVSNGSAKLTISNIGFQTKVITATQNMNISLTVQKSNLADVVVVGYQVQKRREITAAVSSIKGDEIQNIPEASFDMMLQGRLAGVSVQSTTGEPGAKPNIVIRGSTNMDYGNANGGNTSPLYVIDGVIFDLNNMASSYDNSNPLSLIDPNDIESIDVLKDASAAAIYGARGGNGVIIVKTRQAKRSERPQVSLSAYMGVTTRPNFRKVMTGMAERNLKLQLLNNQLPYSDLALGNIPQSLTDSLNQDFSGDVDWQGMLVRDQAIVNNQDLSVAGFFNGNNNYRISLNHYSEQGTIKGYSLERLSPDIKLTLNPLKHLSISADVRISSEKHNHGAGAAGNPYIFNTYNFPTSLVALNATQKAIYSGAANLYDDDKIFTIFGNIEATDTLAKGLLLTGSFGASNFTESYNYYSPAALNGIQNTAYMINASNPNWTWENYLQYSKSIKDHHLTVVGGYAAYQANQYYSYAYAAGIKVSGVYTLQTVPSGANLFVNSNKATKTTASYYGRLSYDYKGKYLLAGSLRRDASSIYSAQYRWGTFSSISAGWIASDEEFFTPAKNVVNFLKLRASYGVTGQDPGTWYAKYQTLYNDASYLSSTTGTFAGDAYYTFLGGVPSTYNGATVISPFNYGSSFQSNAIKSSNTVRWEKYPQLNLGIDLNLFRDRIALVVDWYQKDAKDKFLWSVPADATTGYKYYSGNYADVRNTGLEISVNTRNLGSQSKFQWNTNFNIAFNKNIITRLPNDNRDLLFGDPWFRKVLTLGSPLFSYKLWQANGVYAKESDVPTDPITGSKMTYFGTTMQAGDSRIIDQNGDYNINYDDQVSTGKSPLTKATGGFTNTFSYKDFTLTVFASFSYGNQILNGSFSDVLNGSANYSSWGSVSGPGSLGNTIGQFWAQSGDQTKYPRLVYSSSTGTSSIDPWNISRSYFLEDGSFLKLKQVSLGYNLPHPLLKKLGIRNVNVYGNVQNLFMLKKAKNIADPELYDPTTGSVNINYPTGLKFNLGFRADL